MIDMKTKKVGGPEGRGPDTKRARPSPGNGRVELIRKELERAFDNGLTLPAMTECEPHGEEEKRLTSHLGKKIEPHLKNVAIDQPVTIVVGGIDKSRQNPLNKLGGAEGLGNASMGAHWDITRRAIGAVASINDGESICMHLARVAPRSDEGVLVIGGENLTVETGIQFREAWNMARGRTDLSKYTYSVELPAGPIKEMFNLDLEAFSTVLKHEKKMVVSSKYAISRPIQVTPDTKKGFILDEIKMLENQEVAKFYGRLPKSFKGNGGLAEVHSPFRTNLQAKNVEKTTSGTFVEIKLRIPESDADSLLEVTEDTRKGYAEVFSKHVGMRAFNTFVGKPRANRVLTPITQALGDLGKELDIAVLPVTGGYLQYWLDLPAVNGTAELVRKAIEKRIHSNVKDIGHIRLPFEPVVSMMDATDVGLSEVRERFILKAIGKGLYPPMILEHTDFLINFVENIKNSVQMPIYEQLATGGNGSPLRDLDNIAMVKEICSKRRTIRDTEDLVWVLRKDEGLPDKIKAKKEELENWLFDFAWEKVEKMRLLLFRKVREAMEKREKQERRELLRVVR
jgi:hypothetical protein